MRYSDTIANDIAPIFIQTIFLSIHVNQYSPTKKRVCLLQIMKCRLILYIS